MPGTQPGLRLPAPSLIWAESAHSTLYGIPVITRDNTRRQTEAEADLTGIHREGGDRLGTVSRGILALCLLCSVSACGGLGLSPGQRGPECSDGGSPDLHQRVSCQGDKVTGVNVWLYLESYDSSQFLVCIEFSDCQSPPDTRHVKSS